MIFPALYAMAKHFLGKEAIMNILYFRFANSFLEPIWNRNYDALIAADGGWHNPGPDEETA